MDLLTLSLPFVKVVAAFALMLVGIRNRLGLAWSILAGGVFLGLIFGLPLASLVRIGSLALIQEKFLFLAAIVGLILILSDGLERSGQSKRLMAALSGYLTRPRLRLIFFPALIGLLPMPGGAIFSAPLVKAVSDDLPLADDDRVVINYWFRHVWETAWPLYPGLILTAALAEIPITALIARSWPGVVAMFGIGWFFFLRGGLLAAPLIQQPTEPGATSWPRVAREGLPLSIAIVGAVGLETLLGCCAPTIAFEWGVLAALAAAVGCVLWQNNLGGDFLVAVVGKKGLWSMLAVIAAIFVFKDLLQAAHIVEAMAAVAGGGIALVAAAVVLPWLVGMIAGINVAFVGATFPLLIGLLQSLGMEEQLLPYLILGTFSGFTGVMLSPIHICFVLTCSYFATEPVRTWRRLIAPSLCFGLFGGLLFRILLD